MKSSDYLKSWLIAAAILLGSALLADNCFGQTKPIPTTKDCGCIEYKGYKYNGKSIGIGVAIVYTDAVVFKIGNTSVVMQQVRPDLYQDDKGKIYIRTTDEDGAVIFRGEKIIFYYTKIITNQ